MRSHYDIGIIGGGPAGAVLAFLLARNGKSVAVFEADKFPRRKICGEYLCPKGVELLFSLGMGEVFTPANRKIKGMRLLSPSGLEVLSNFPSSTFEGGRSVRRDVFDEALRNLSENAGAQIYRGTRIERLLSEESHWRIESADKSFYAKTLIGADGRQSLVARHLGLEFAPSKKRIAIHLYVSTHSATPLHGEMHILSRGRYVGMCPTGENEWNISLICDADEVKQNGGARSTLEQAFAESPSLTSRFLPLEKETKLLVTYPITHAVNEVAGKNWALVGDAAGFLDPLTGEGMFQALLSTSLLAKELNLPASNETSDQALALKRYSRNLQKSLTEKKRLNQIFQHIIHQGWACDLIGRFLSGDQRRADSFIGIIGNIYRPQEGLRKMFF